MNYFRIGLVLTLFFLHMAHAQTETPVTFTRDDLQLVGMLHLPPATGNRVPAVLFLHGFTGHKSDTHFIFTRVARRLSDLGIASLRFDFAGSGDSEGEFADMTILTELADAHAALTFLKRYAQIDSTTLGLLGFSMGGCVAALLAGEVDDFSTMVLWAPVAFPLQNFSDIPKNYPQKRFNGQPIYDVRGYYVGQKFIDVLPRLTPLKSAARFKQPVLVIQGDKDKSVPQEAGKAYAELFEANNPDSRLQVIAGGNHTFSTMELTDAVLTLSSDWFRSRLRAESN